ncbi:MAG: STAS domain-containing protein [Spirochaetes bacterium]|nr:STAS domain-containing protein [Spirochaetota bacterium]
MGLEHRFVKDILVVNIAGSDGTLAPQGVDEVISEILGLYNGKRKEIALDLTQKTYLNSSGLGDLIKVKDRFSDEGVELVLINPTPRVTSLLEMVGVIQFFKIIPGVEDLG